MKNLGQVKNIRSEYVLTMMNEGWRSGYASILMDLDSTCGWKDQLEALCKARVFVKWVTTNNELIYN